MYYKFFKIFIFFLIVGCTQGNVNTNSNINPTIDQKYNNKGFGLIYNSFLNLSFNVQTAKPNLSDLFHFKITS